MRFNEHDSEYGAFTLNLDDFEQRQQRKFSRKLSRLRTDALLFFAKLKLKAQAKKQHWDDDDIRWELNAVESRMQPHVRPRQIPEAENRLAQFKEKLYFKIHKLNKAQANDFEQSEDFAALYRVTLEKFTQPMKRDEFYRLIGAFVYRLQASGVTKSRAKEIMYELLCDAAEAAHEEEFDAQLNAPDCEMQSENDV